MVRNPWLSVFGNVLRRPVFNKSGATVGWVIALSVASMKG